jgi:hypothetical protein
MLLLHQIHLLEKEVNPVTELQPLKFTDSVNNIEFRLQGDNALQEIIRLDSEGFHYRGQLIEDAGEAHRLMVEFLKQSTQSQPEPVAPTDEELIEPIVWMIDERVYDTDKGEIAESLRELIARWGTPANNTREENLEVSNG